MIQEFETLALFSLGNKAEKIAVILKPWDNHAYMNYYIFFPLILAFRALFSHIKLKKCNYLKNYKNRKNTWPYWLSVNQCALLLQAQCQNAFSKMNFGSSFWTFRNSWLNFRENFSCFSAYIEWTLDLNLFLMNYLKFLSMIFWSFLVIFKIYSIFCTKIIQL